MIRHRFKIEYSPVRIRILNVQVKPTFPPSQNHLPECMVLFLNFFQERVGNRILAPLLQKSDNLFIAYTAGSGIPKGNGRNPIRMNILGRFYHF